jgi:outer membrane protein OmpA-like peptidoglycan-associated protein
MREHAVLVAPVLAVTAFVASMESAAARRMTEATGEAAAVERASAADDAYCTPELKKVVRRVAGACGLLASGGRGCKPADAKSVASLTGSDFNAMFLPLAQRASIIQFDLDKPELDDAAKAAVEKAWSEQRGASFFFVVARASPEGGGQHNQELSQARAEAVLGHLEARFQDPDIRSQVGLLWLGEDYAQLGAEFCRWTRSRQDECDAKDINRSAFVAWIDCAI